MSQHPSIIEATVHTTEPFRSMKTQNLKINDLRDALRDWMVGDANEQHIRFLSHFGRMGDAPDNPISDYTQSFKAKKLNRTAIYNHNKKHNIYSNVDTENAKEEHFEKLDTALRERSKPLPEETHVYSGTGSWDLSHLKEGDVLHTPAYTSTTIHAPKVFRFGHSTFLHFRLPKGSTHGVYIAGDSWHPNEKEFLLHRDQKWKITKVKKYNRYGDTNQRLISLEPHVENIQEVLHHNPDEVDKILKNGVETGLYKLKTKWSSLPIHIPHTRFTDDQKTAIKNFSSFTSTDINRALIAGDHEFLNNNTGMFSVTAPTYRHIKSILNNAKPLPVSHSLYSGTGSWDPLTHQKDGLFKTPAFTSTSHSIDVARSFSSGARPGQPRTIIHFKLPKLYNKAVHVGDTSAYSHEKEVILDHSQIWRIKDVTHHSDYWGGTIRLIHAVPHNMINEALEHKPNLRDFTSVKREGVDWFPKKPDTKEHKHLLKTFNHVKKDKVFSGNLYNYGFASTEINLKLLKREKVNDSVHKILLNKFKKYPVALEQDHHVYSSVGNDPNKYLKNGIFRTPAWTSTSIYPSVAIQHSNSKNSAYDGLDKVPGVHDEHIIHFHLPKGYVGAHYIQGHTDFDEYEMLLKPNQKWKVINKQTILPKAKKRVYTIDPYKIKSIPVRRHIWTVVPHENVVNEALEHNPKVQLYRNTASTPEKHAIKYKNESLKRINIHVKNINNEADDLYNHHEAINRLPEHLSDSLHNYTRDSSVVNLEMIEHHNTGKPLGTYSQNQVRNIQHTIEHHAPELEQDHHVYSGTYHEPFDKLKSGDTVHLPAFTSSSLDINTSKNFSGRKKTIFHFHLPKGYKNGLFIKNISNIESENEYLINAGQKWKVHDKKKYSGGFSSLTGKRHTYTVISLKPHTEDLQEEIEHRGRDYFDDEHPNLDFYQQHAQTAKHPNTEQFEKHKAQVRVDARKTNNLLPPLSKVSFTRYSRGSSLINSQLIHGVHPPSIQMKFFDKHGLEINDVIHHISNGIKEANNSLKDDLHVYSGTSHPKLVSGYLDPSIIGSVIHTPAFTSTSIRHTVAKIFANEGSEHHIIHFHLPKGYNKGVYIEDHSSLPHENEFLLDKDQHWKITKHEKFTTRNELGMSIPRHVWTVVPHDKTITEGLNYHPDLFKNHQLHDYRIGGTSVHHVNHNAIKRRDMEFKRSLLQTAHKKLLESIPFDPDFKERKVIRSYTDNRSGDINKYLINGKQPTSGTLTPVHNLIGDLHQTINEHGKPLPQDLHVYSGLGYNPEEHFKDGIIHTPAFTSASISTEIPLGFTAHFKTTIPGEHNQHVLHFHLPKGYKNGLYIQPYSSLSGEHEYLLNKNQHWKLVDHQTRARKTLALFDDTVHRTKNHIHIWTVVPHEDNIQELYKPWDRKKFQRELNPKEGIATGYFMDKDWYGNKYKVPKEAAEHHKHMNALFEDHYKNDHVVKSVKHYTEGGSYDINPALIRAHRLGKDPSEAHTVPSYGADKYDDLKKSFKDVPKLDHDVHAYSGLGFDPTKHFEEHGGVFHSPAFVSTSLNPMVASGIGATHSNRGTPMHIIHFHLPKGYGKALYAGNPKANEYYIKQHELILDHNQKFKKVSEMTVSAKSKYGKHTAIIHTVVPHDYNNIHEAFKHDDSLEAFKDVRDYLPVKDSYNPKHREEHVHLSKLHSSNIDPVSIKMHTRASYGFNTALINSPSIATYERARRLSDALTKNLEPLTRDHHVYSGLGEKSPSEIFEQNDGVFKAKHFISTSIDPTVANAHKNFKSSYIIPESHVLHIHLPIGYSKGRYIAPVSAFKTEHEFLLDRNQHFKLIGKETIQHDDGKRKTTIWSVIPHDPNNIHETTVHSTVPFRSFITNKNGSLTAKSKRYTDQTHQLHVRNIDIDVGSQDQRLVSHFQNLHETPEDVIPHIRKYTGTGSSTINVALATKDTTHPTIEYARKLNKIISTHSKPLPEKVHTYSGLHDWIPNVKEGDILHTPAFTSTSLHPALARGFSAYSSGKMKSGSVKGGIKHILHFELPKGYKNGLYVSHISQHPDEYEFLLNSNQKWKVQKIKDHNNYRHEDDTYLNVKSSSVAKVRVYTLTPHDDEKHIQEMFEHDPNTFTSSMIHLHKDGIIKPIYNKDVLEQHKSKVIAHDKHMSKLVENSSPLSEADRSHLQHYTRGDISYSINQHLLDPKNTVSSDYKDLIHKIPDIINRHGHTLDHEAHVYSGLGFDPTDHFKDGIIHMPAFTSTSLNPSTTKSFGHQKIVKHNNVMRNRKNIDSKYSEHHIMHFHLPKGYNQGMYLEHITKYPGENEYLLNRGQHFRLIKHEKRRSFFVQRTGKSYTNKSYVVRHIWSVIPHTDTP